MYGFWVIIWRKQKKSFSHKHVAYISTTEFFTPIRVKIMIIKRNLNSSQKMLILFFSFWFPLPRTCCPAWEHCAPFRLLSFPPLLLPPSSLLAGTRRPTCQLAGCGGFYLGASSNAEAALERLRGPSPSWRWSICSHELRLLHRLLVCGRVPRGVAGDIRAGRAHGGLDGSRRCPDRCHGGRAGGKSTTGG